MKEHFLKKIAELQQRALDGKDAAEKQAHIQARRDAEAFRRFSDHIAEVVRPAFEAFAEALDEQRIKVILRFEEGVLGRLAELPPMAEATIPRRDKEYSLSYRLEGTNFIMLLALGGMERRAILPPVRLNNSRVRTDLDALLEASLSSRDQISREP